jgi:hypothetical protein
MASEAGQQQFLRYQAQQAANLVQSNLQNSIGQQNQAQHMGANGQFMTPQQQFAALQQHQQQQQQMMGNMGQMQMPPGGFPQQGLGVQGVQGLPQQAGMANMMAQMASSGNHQQLAQQQLAQQMAMRQLAQGTQNIQNAQNVGNMNMSRPPVANPQIMQAQAAAVARAKAMAEQSLAQAQQQQQQQQQIMMDQQGIQQQNFGAPRPPQQMGNGKTTLPPEKIAQLRATISQLAKMTDAQREAHFQQVSPGRASSLNQSSYADFGV